MAGSQVDGLHFGRGYRWVAFCKIAPEEAARPREPWVQITLSFNSRLPEAATMYSQDLVRGFSDVTGSEQMSGNSSTAPCANYAKRRVLGSFGTCREVLGSVVGKCWEI